MEKFYEKKNFGIPTVILCVIAYLIGYLLSFNLEGGLLVAILFAAIVFGCQFDDKVKSAVKQSYIIAILARVVYLGFDLLEDFIGLISPQEFSIGIVFGSKLEDISDLYDLNAFHEVLLYIDRYGKAIFGILVTVAFFVFIIHALRNKEVKFQFVSRMLGEGIPKTAPAYQPQAYQQPVPPVQPQVQPQVQPAPTAPVQPAATPGTACPNCGRVNQPGAAFCASCGTKL